MDLKATADAIAARYVGVTATVGSASEALLIPPTASLPNAIGKGPALLVFPPEGVLGVSPMRQRTDVWTFQVRLLRDPVNYPARTDWLYAWANVLRDRVEMNTDLDLPYVAWAHTEGEAALELDGYTYGDLEYDQVLLTVRVRFDEVITTMAI